MKNIIKEVKQKRFHFIDSFYLNANIEIYKDDSYRQKLILEIKEKDQYRPLNSLNCIHTAVTTITKKEFDEMMKNVDLLVEKQSEFQDLIRENQGILSTETTELTLDPDESFKVFISWVQGIAEFGLDSLEIQGTIDQIGKFDVRVRDFLVKGLMKISDFYLNDQIANIKQICRNFKVWDKNSTIANFIPVLDIIYQKFINDLNWIDIFAKIYKLDLPIEVFLVKKEYSQLLDIFTQFYT